MNIYDPDAGCPEMSDEEYSILKNRIRKLEVKKLFHGLYENEKSELENLKALKERQKNKKIHNQLKNFLSKYGIHFMNFTNKN